MSCALPSPAASVLCPAGIVVQSQQLSIHVSGLEKEGAVGELVAGHPLSLLLMSVLSATAATLYHACVFTLLE